MFALCQIGESGSLNCYDKLFNKLLQCNFYTEDISGQETHFELLVIIAVMNDHKAKVKPAGQIKEMVCFSFGPGIIMKVHLILLLRINRNLHRL